MHQNLLETVISRQLLSAHVMQEEWLETQKYAKVLTAVRFSMKEDWMSVLCNTH